MCNGGETLYLEKIKRIKFRSEKQSVSPPSSQINCVKIRTNSFIRPKIKGIKTKQNHSSLCIGLSSQYKHNLSCLLLQNSPIYILSITRVVFFFLRINIFFLETGLTFVEVNAFGYKKTILDFGKSYLNGDNQINKLINGDKTLYKLSPVNISNYK